MDKEDTKKGIIMSSKLDFILRGRVPCVKSDQIKAAIILNTIPNSFNNKY